MCQADFITVASIIHACGRLLPQRDEKFAGERNDRRLFESTAIVLHALLQPARRRRAGLVTHLHCEERFIAMPHVTPTLAPNGAYNKRRPATTNSFNGLTSDEQGAG